MKQVAEGVFLFCNDDDGYNKWIRENPDGFVVNTYKKPSARYLKTHKAKCRTIMTLQPRYSSFTAEYSKYCSNDLDKLKKWASKELNGELQFCLICMR